MATVTLTSGNVRKFPDSECRLVVVGKTGSGKSSLVNTLLGENLCQVSEDWESCTLDAKLYSRPRFGKDVRVVDTPGLFDSRPEMTNEMVLKKVASTALMVAPGPHALLMTLVCGQRFTHEEQAVVKHLKDFFGEGSLQHTVVVFTRRDELDRKNVKIEDYVKKAPAGLKQLLNDVANRYVFISNVSQKPAERDKNAESLLNVVEMMVRLSKNPFYNSELFTSAEMEMQMMDKEAEKGFRPRAGSTSSLVSLDASMRGLQIDSIISADSGIASQTSLTQEAKKSPKDKQLMTDIASKLVRLFTRNQVSEGHREGAVASLLSSHAMVSLAPLLQAQEDPEVQGRSKRDNEFSNK